MPADHDPVQFNYASGLKIADAVHRIMGRGAGERPLPKRPRHVVSGGQPVRMQLAVVIDLFNPGATPHYTSPPFPFAPSDIPTDTTFRLAIDYNAVIIARVLLLDTESGGDPGELSLEGHPVPIANPDGLTVEELQLDAQDVRKEGNPQVGDVVRIWRGDGLKVSPGMNGNGDAVIYCEPLNVGDYLRGLDTFSYGTPRLLSSEATTGLMTWVDYGDAGSVPGWVFTYPSDPIPSSGHTAAEGYAIDVSTAGTVDTIGFDPTEIHNHTTVQFQFYTHRPAGDPDNQDRWMTATNYHDSFAAIGNLTGQFVTNIGGGQLKFENHFNFDDATDQMLFSLSGQWNWMTTNGYDITTTNPQLLGQINGIWYWKFLDEWLRLLSSYDETKNQLIGHPAGATPPIKWMDVTGATVNNPTSIELNLGASTLESKLNTSGQDVIVLAGIGGGGGGGSLSDTVPVDNC